MARLEGTSGQSSSSLPGTHPLLVRSPETPHTPAPTAAAAMRSRGGVPVRHRSYRVGNPQTLVHFIDNSGRTSRLGHTAPTSLLNRYYRMSCIQVFGPMVAIRSCRYSILGPSFANAINFSGSNPQGNARFHFITHDNRRQQTRQDVASMFEDLLHVRASPPLSDTLSFHTNHDLTHLSRCVILGSSYGWNQWLE